jgi:hypothetical protein
MKSNKLLFIFIGLFLLVSAIQLTSACKHNDYNDCDNEYALRNGDDVIFIFRNVDYTDDYNSYYWENEDRFPVYDYREGYSYRAKRVYQDSLNERIYRNDYYEEEYNSRRPRPVEYKDEAEYYYTYNEYMETYTKHKCYSNPPKDKLFYIKCP